MASYGEVTIGELLTHRIVRLEVATLLSISEAALLRSISQQDENSTLGDLYDPVPADLARTNVAEARGDDDVIERLVRHTGLMVDEIVSELRRTHGRTLLPKVFDFIWPERMQTLSAPAAVPEQVKPRPPAGSRAQNEPPSRTRLFISYSQLDRFYVDRLLVHLRPLQRQGLVDIWDDSKIRTGYDWQSEISDALESAGAAVLIVSADFAASGFIVENELPVLLESNKKKGLKLFPVIVGHISVSMHKTGILKFQAINKPDRPLNSLPDHEREKLLADLATRIYEALTK